MRLSLVVITAFLMIAMLGSMCQAMTLTQDPATMAALSMFLAQWCKDQGMSYWETFLWTTTLSVAKEMGDQAGGHAFSSGDIGINLLGMSFSWFTFDF